MYPHLSPRNDEVREGPSQNLIRTKVSNKKTDRKEVNHFRGGPKDFSFAPSMVEMVYESQHTTSVILIPV